ncbi:MAG: radical SAM protein [Candidatus Omnitrophota bacterium]|nr:radical SAM protein [Candidatus Omnitrophota bacterium]MBU3930704.1 radical SAM protein [bacterium]MBU4123603.1 radical SAM protein [bacterium]
MKYKYLFGPVPSRRLGLSLGIDLVPLKTCSFNCVYCECGATTALTVSRREYVPASRVIEELDDFLSGKPDLDFITFAGSGEPTLHSRIGDVISFVKNKFPQYRVCVLTNGSLFHLKSVRADLMRADKVIPSLDAASVSAWKKLNRPHGSLDLKKLINALEMFGKEYEGDYAVEVFIVPGVNDSTEELSRLKKALMKIKPSSVQLNSLVRPGTETSLRCASEASLKKIARFFAPLKAELAGAPGRKISPAFKKGLTHKILSAVSRRPLTLEDLAAVTGLRIVELTKIADALRSSGRVVFIKQGRKNFIKKAEKKLTRRKQSGKQII